MVGEVVRTVMWLSGRGSEVSRFHPSDTLQYSVVFPLPVLLSVLV